MAGGASEECGGNGENLQFLGLVLLLYVEIVFVLCAPNLNGAFSFGCYIAAHENLKFGLKKGGSKKKSVSRELLIILIIMIINF